MNKLTLIKTVVLIHALAYLVIYSVFFPALYTLAETNWLVYSKFFAVTVAVAIGTVIFVPTELVLQRLID